jgi:hypothetical protein
MMPFVTLVIMLAQTNSTCLNLPSVKTEMMQKVKKCLHCAKIPVTMHYLSTSWSWLKKGCPFRATQAWKCCNTFCARWPEWQVAIPTCNPQHKSNCPAEYHKICTNSTLEASDSKLLQPKYTLHGLLPSASFFSSVCWSSKLMLDLRPHTCPSSSSSSSCSFSLDDFPRWPNSSFS